MKKWLIRGLLAIVALLLLALFVFPVYTNTVNGARNQQIGFTQTVEVEANVNADVWFLTVEDAERTILLFPGIPGGSVQSQATKGLQASCKNRRANCLVVARRDKNGKSINGWEMFKIAQRYVQDQDLAPLEGFIAYSGGVLYLYDIFKMFHELDANHGLKYAELYAPGIFNELSEIPNDAERGMFAGVLGQESSFFDDLSGMESLWGDSIRETGPENLGYFTYGQLDLLVKWYTLYYGNDEEILDDPDSRRALVITLADLIIHQDWFREEALRLAKLKREDFRGLNTRGVRVTVYGYQNDDAVSQEMVQKFAEVTGWPVVMLPGPHMSPFRYGFLPKSGAPVNPSFAAGR